VAREAIGLTDANAALHVVASQLSTKRDPVQALRHAQAAYEQTPDDLLALSTLCEAHLAAGEPDRAADIAKTLRERSPLDQRAIALLATAWRLMDDPRYRELYDYQRLVRPQTIETPKGWPNLAAYLADLAQALRALHIYRIHPLGQSLRGGSQTQQSLAQSTDPVIQAFFQAVDEPIRRHIESLMGGPGHTSSRATGDYRFQGAWSVRLRGGGFHTNHLHQWPGRLDHLRRAGRANPAGPGR
jgi:hypothetical protein